MDIQFIGIWCGEKEVRAAILNKRPDNITLTKTLDAGLVEIYAEGLIFKYNLEGIARYVIRNKIHHDQEV